MNGRTSSSTPRKNPIMSDQVKPKSTGEIAAAALSCLVVLDSGDRAKIRHGQRCAAFWRVWARAGLENTHGTRAEAWEHVIKSLATFIGTRSGQASSFISEQRIGQNLAAIGMKELRFEKMILAPLEARWSLLDRAVMMMARKSPCINIYDLCDLYIFEEPARLRAISSSYYRSAA